MPRYITMSISRKFIIRLVRECSLNKLEQRRDSPYSMSKLIIENICQDRCTVLFPTDKPKLTASLVRHIFLGSYTYICVYMRPRKAPLATKRDAPSATIQSARELPQDNFLRIKSSFGETHSEI